VQGGAGAAGGDLDRYFVGDMSREGAQGPFLSRVGSAACGHLWRPDARPTAVHSGVSRVWSPCKVCPPNPNQRRCCSHVLRNAHSRKPCRCRKQSRRLPGPHFEERLGGHRHARIWQLHAPSGQRSQPGQLCRQQKTRGCGGLFPVPGKFVCTFTVPAHTDARRRGGSDGVCACVRVCARAIVCWAVEGSVETRVWSNGTKRSTPSRAVPCPPVASLCRSKDGWTNQQRLSGS